MIPTGCVQTLFEGIKRAGPDIPEYDAQRSDRQRAEARFMSMVRRHNTEYRSAAALWARRQG